MLFCYLACGQAGVVEIGGRDNMRCPHRHFNGSLLCGTRYGSGHESACWPHTRVCSGSRDRLGSIWGSERCASAQTGKKRFYNVIGSLKSGG